MSRKIKHIFIREKKRIKNWGGDYSLLYGDESEIIKAETIEQARLGYFMKIKHELIEYATKMTFEDFLEDLCTFDQLCNEDECYQWAEEGSDYCEHCNTLIGECESGTCDCDEWEDDMSEENKTVTKKIKMCQPKGDKHGKKHRNS